MPPCYKELSQLIRQLSLCSAKVEVENGSAVPDTVLNILQKLEVRYTKCEKETFGQRVSILSQKCILFLFSL